MIDLSTPGSPDADWYVMGELELPLNSNADDTLTTWLRDVVIQLDLNTDFLSEILKSAQDTLARVRQSDPAGTACHIHFSILMRNHPMVKGHPWGFFQMERSGSTKLDKEYFGHTIQFHLYQEGPSFALNLSDLIAQRFAGIQLCSLPFKAG